MTIGIVGNPDKPGLSGAVAALMARLEGLGVSFVIDRKLLPLLGQRPAVTWAKAARDLQVCIDDSDMLIAFGGDGTMLGIAREIGARGTPLLGVNLGKLGFLAELNPEELDSGDPRSPGRQVPGGRQDGPGGDHAGPPWRQDHRDQRRRDRQVALAQTDRPGNVH